MSKLQHCLSVGLTNMTSLNLNYSFCSLSKKNQLTTNEVPLDRKREFIILIIEYEKIPTLGLILCTFKLGHWFSKYFLFVTEISTAYLFRHWSINHFFRHFPLCVFFVNIELSAISPQINDFQIKNYTILVCSSF